MFITDQAHSVAFNSGGRHTYSAILIPVDKKKNSLQKLELSAHNQVFIILALITGLDMFITPV